MKMSVISTWPFADRNPLLMELRWRMIENEIKKHRRWTTVVGRVLG